MIYRKEIDGLRALAVIPVVLFHAEFNVLSGGFVGVDIFFVISGFLITAIILEELQQKNFSLLQFYERRARRILPALFFMMMCCIPFAWMWMLPDQFKDFSESIFAVTFFLSNFLFNSESGYFELETDQKPLLHTWSLAVEEQYYILFPFMLLLIWRYNKQNLSYWILGGILMSLALSQYASKHFPTANFYLAPTRAWELWCGSLCAIYISKYRMKSSDVGALMGVGLLAYSTVFFSDLLPYPSFYTLIPVIGTSLIILFAGPDTIVGKFLSTRLLVGIGLISYSTYLWHQPLLAFVKIRSLNQPSEVQLLVLVGLSFVIGYVSWRFVEAPFRNKNRTIKVWQLACILVAFVSFFTTFGFYGHLNDGLPERVAPEVRYYLEAADDRSPHDSKCLFDENRELPELPVQECILYDNANTSRYPNVALWGDSHAASLSEALRETLAEDNGTLLQLTYSGCPPIAGVDRIDLPVSHQCSAFNQRVESYLIDNEAIRTVVLVARWTMYVDGTFFNNGEGGVETGKAVKLGNRASDIAQESRELVLNGLEQTLHKLLQAGKDVILIDPIPEAGWDVPEYLAKAKMADYQIPLLTTDYNNYLKRHENTFQIFEQFSHPSLYRLKPQDLLCNTLAARRCLNKDADKILYFDDDHLSSAGAAIVAKEIRSVIRGLDH